MATTAFQPTPAHQLSAGKDSQSTQAFLSSVLDPTIKNQGAPVPRGPVETELSFFKAPADGSVPYNFVNEPPEGVPRSNIGENKQKVTIADVRGRESEFSLDRNAFQTVSGVPSAETTFDDDDRIKAVYYPEVEKVIFDNVPGSNRVLIFDHTIRRSGPNAARGPVNRTHIDQTPRAAAMRVQHHLPAEAAELLKARYRIINVWRPLNGPVVASPLAVADASSLQDGDVVPVEHRYPDRTGETAAVVYRGAVRWNYWSGMQNDERLLLQCSDSQHPEVRVPHTAFTDPRTPEGAPGRESIEVRALVFG